MVGNNIQFAGENILVAEPFADIMHITGEVEVGVSQFHSGLLDIHLPVGVCELNERNMYRFRQSFRQ